MTKARMIQAGLVLLALLLVAGLAVAGMAWAGASSSAALDWQVLSGGGVPALSASESIALNGSLGQTAIGSSSGDRVTLGAGFWYRVGTGVYEIYLPVVLRDSG